MRALIRIALLAALLLPACHKASRKKTSSPPPSTWINTMEPGKFLTAPGSWQYADPDGWSYLRISVRGGELRWQVDFQPERGRRASPGNRFKVESPSDPWFAFMESPGSFWFFDGKDSLYHSASGPDPQRGGSSLIKGKLDPAAPLPPPAVIRQLPAELQALYPKVEAPRRLPSI